MSVQLSNIFPQPVTFRTQETVAVLLHVVDVAKVVFIQAAKTYYHQYLQYRQMASKDCQGVCLDDLMVLEQLFQTNIFVYDLQEMEEGDIAARLVRRSPYSYQETMNLNL
jgi:hypothetical protein